MIHCIAIQNLILRGIVDVETAVEFAKVLNIKWLGNYARNINFGLKLHFTLIFLYFFDIVANLPRF